jgi:predicted PurR-regulated permease PerM
MTNIEQQAPQPEVVVPQQEPQSEVPEAPEADVSVTARPFGSNAFRRAILATLGVLLVLLLSAAVASISGVVFSVFAAAFITLGLDPLIRWFQRRGMKRGIAILTVILLFVVVVIGLLWLLLPLIIEQAGELFASLPQMFADLQAQQWYQDAAAGTGGILSTIYENVVAFFSDPATWKAAGGGLVGLVVGVIGAISSAFFIFILTIYFTGTLDTTKNAFYQLVSASHRTTFVGYAERIMQNIGRYLSGMVILAFMNATFSLIILTIAGVEFALVISVGAFFITLIPLIGTVLTTIFMTVFALFTSPQAALIVLISMLIYMQVEAYIFTPRVMSKAVQVPGSLVLISALAGGTLGGLPGALIAIPLAAGILIIIREVVVPAKARS